MPPSFNPALGMMFVTARESCATFVPQEPEFEPGRNTSGGVIWVDRDQGYGAFRAIDVRTGERMWEFRYPSPTMAGVMKTVSGLVFAGDHEGNFMAFEAQTGKNLWHTRSASRIWGAAPMTHMLDGRQYVLIPSGTTLVAFALPDDCP